MKKLSHAALICFHYFSDFLVQSKHKSIKKTLCGVILLSCYATFKLLCYFKLTKLKEVMITGDSMAGFDLL